jgi:hypothetical protein
MLNNRIILIGSSVILCSILLLITLYYLYHHYRQKKNLSLKNIEELKTTNVNQLIKQENHSPKITEELMRKSLELAKTAEKVADKNQKRLTLEENIHFHL